MVTENPFASTHSLDTNPFDDPVPERSAAASESSDIRIEELNRRERELEAREAALNQKAEHIRLHGRNNWPPFLPLVFHSIQDEIPEASRPLMTRMYQLWLAFLLTLLLNFVACLILVITGGPLNDLIVSVIYLPLFTLLSFLLWYRPIYNGYMKEQALYYYVYFFFGGFHLLFSLYMAVGIPGTGSAGIIQTISAFVGGHIVAGVFCILAAIGWVVQGLGLAWFYRLIWQHGNAAGHSLAKAKGELATHGAKAYFSRG